MGCSLISGYLNHSPFSLKYIDIPVTLLQKKKTKDGSKKSATRNITPLETPPPPISEEESQDLVNVASTSDSINLVTKDSSSTNTIVENKTNLKQSMLGMIQNQEILESNLQSSEKKPDTIHEVSISNVDTSYEMLNISNDSNVSNLEDSFVELSKKLKRMAIPAGVTERTPEKEFEVLSPTAYLKQESPCILEDVVPSAPCFEEMPQSVEYQEEILECKPKLKALPIEDVMRLYSGGEMEDVRSMIEREEEIVEAGPVSGPEHPLVDLLSTFRYVCVFPFF